MSQTVLSTTDNVGLGLSKPAKVARIYSCSRCPKTFKRSEHCSRHERGHTQEKPFHCRYCGRRYARKDLVNRHERSFHPLADKINPDSTENEVVVVDDCGRSPPPPELAVLGSSPSHNLATILVTPLDSEGESTLQNTIHVNPAGAQSTINGVPSPAPSVVTFMEPGTTTGVDESQNANVSTFAGDQSSVETVSTINLQQSISDLHAWDASDIMWQNADQFTNSDSIAQSNIGHTTHAPQHSDDENYLNNFDILSMMPKNGVDFEGDFSTYLIHSGYSPVENMDMPHQAHGNSPLLQSSLLETNNSYPIPIGAKAVPFNTDREQGSGTFSRMPNVMTETPRKLPVPVVDSDAYESIVADAKKRLSSDQLEEIEMLSSQDMQQFLTSYFTCFHRHCPIIHPTSVDLRSVPSYLVFAICALGALYRLRRKTAKDLWYWANLMVEKELPVSSSESFSRTGTAIVQCRMLLGMFAIFSGDMTERAISGAGYWSTEYRSRRSALALMPYNASTTEWEQWISREASKRLLYGIFIMSSMMTVTYDLCPAFSVTQDLDIEILDEECLWEASTLEQWQALRKSQTPRSSITVRDAMNHLIFGKEDSNANPTRWTAFATTMIFHAVNVHMWHIMQCTQSFTAFAVDEQNNRVLKAALVLQVETALARCYALLTADRLERDHTSDDPEGPLIFNCLALLRSAYVRVFTGAGNFDRMMLLSEEPLQIANSVDEYVTGPQERTPFLTRAVDKAYGGLLTPIKAGYLLVQKTAALSWSFEHAVAAWDCALFVTKWIHALEMQQQELPPNEEEMRNLVNFRELLAEVDSDYNGFGSLAGEVTRIWAGFLDDTWVFGITPRMGKVLRQLSNAFAQDWKAKFPQGNSAGPISR